LQQELVLEVRRTFHIIALDMLGQHFQAAELIGVGKVSANMAVVVVAVNGKVACGAKGNRALVEEVVYVGNESNRVLKGGTRGR